MLFILTSHRQFLFSHTFPFLSWLMKLSHFDVEGRPPQSYCPYKIVQYRSRTRLLGQTPKLIHSGLSYTVFSKFNMIQGSNNAHLWDAIFFTILVHMHVVCTIFQSNEVKQCIFIKSKGKNPRIAYCFQVFLHWTRRTVTGFGIHHYFSKKKNHHVWSVKVELHH